jgi:hypothetical protein
MLGSPPAARAAGVSNAQPTGRSAKTARSQGNARRKARWPGVHELLLPAAGNGIVIAQLHGRDAPHLR